MADKKENPITDEYYPKNLIEFDEWFASEEACVDYLTALRWPEGFVCPYCKSQSAWQRTRRVMICTHCRKETPVTAGTIFHKTRKPLRTWYRAMWWVTSQKYGANALGLKRILGLGSYQTAWLWLHKLRSAMVRPDRDRLNGSIEVDETYIGGLEEGVHGRETDKKAILAVAAEIRGKRAIGRIRLGIINDVTARSLQSFIKKTIEPGSTIVTDGWPGYKGIEKLSYQHTVKIIRGSGQAAHKLLPRVHRVSSLFKRWVLGTHQGAVSIKHLDYYLDEFTFRFNRRTSRHRGKLFFRLMQQATTVKPTTYKTLVNR